MSKSSHYAIVVAATFLLLGCESVRYVESELTGTARPTGGVQGTIPATKTYKANPQALRRATLDILDEQGYVYEENPSTGTIKTEPKLLTDQNTVMLVGASYSVKLFVKLDGSSVTCRARFDKKSNLTMGEQNIVYPEKENELRKDFFAALDEKLGH